MILKPALEGFITIFPGIRFRREGTFIEILHSPMVEPVCYCIEPLIDGASVDGFFSSTPVELYELFRTQGITMNLARELMRNSHHRASNISHIRAFQNQNPLGPTSFGFQVPFPSRPP